MNMHELSGKAKGNILIAEIDPILLGFSPRSVWNPSPSLQHYVEPYKLPKNIRIGVSDSLETAARFSPPPFAIVVENGSQKQLIGVKANAGWHRWNYIDFDVTRSGIKIQVDFEGHTSLREASKHILFSTIPGRDNETRMELLARGLQYLYPRTTSPCAKIIPSWWSRPIYCGWGDQVGLSMHLEGPAGYEGECRALAYCTQGLYTKWIERLEEAKVPVGTITIDNGWSDAGVWTPYPNQWPDLRGFIDTQHKKGHKVLLWIPTWLYEGLPDEWCVWMGKTKLAADTTHPKYREFLKAQVHRLLSSSKDGYNADGFKIDQLAYVPSESRPQGGAQFGRMISHSGPHSKIKLHGNSWGCELLWQLQYDIYDAAKNAKPDCLVTSSTVHPYFKDTFDMVRLHDAGIICSDIFSAMKARADLAKAALPCQPIDTDDWIHSDYDKWVNYTCRSHELGVPCIFYAQWFVQNWNASPAAKEVPMADLKKIGRIWNKNGLS